MRKCARAALLGVFLLTGRTAFADSIAIGDTLHTLNDGGTIYGGVFQVDDLSLPGAIDLLTFCVQLPQEMNSTDFLTVANISLIADDEDGPDPLDDRTAWIYSQFREPGQGALAGYTENEIQSAIWVIEDEWTFAEENIFFPGMEPTLRNNATAIMAAAQGAVAGGYVNQNVRLLNLFFINDGRVAQDLLVLTDGGNTTQDTTVPEPGTILLVGSGAAAMIRRHVKSRRK